MPKKMKRGDAFEKAETTDWGMWDLQIIRDDATRGTRLSGQTHSLPLEQEIFAGAAKRSSLELRPIQLRSDSRSSFAQAPSPMTLPRGSQTRTALLRRLPRT
jgi:hypothetical protein